MSAPTDSQPFRARMRIRFGAHPPAGRALHQALFAKLLPLVAVRRVRRAEVAGAQGLARAIDSIRGNDNGAPESDWIERIERRRASFAAREEPVTVTLASGERRQYPPRHLGEVSSIHRPWGVFLMHLTRELRPSSCIELGSAIGISAAYQGAALDLNGSGRLIAVEGARELAEIARETLSAVGIDRVEVVEGRFEEVLDAVLADAAPIDLVYIDAGKGREHNVGLFRRLLPHLSPGAALVIDDIHWSREMNAGWREMRADPRVALSVDLWRLGACLMRAD